MPLRLVPLLCAVTAVVITAEEPVVVEVPRPGGAWLITIPGDPAAPAGRIAPAAVRADGVHGIGQAGQPLLISRRLVVRLAEVDLARHGLRLVRRFDWDDRLLEVEPLAAGPLAGIQAGAALRSQGIEVEEQIGRRLTRHGTTPGDPLFAQQWHLVNSGSGQVAGGVAGQDIHISPYWLAGSPQGGAGINIAVIDDGIDSTHEDLTGSIATTIDYDYLSNDADSTHVASDLGHGTVVAGLIGARRNSVGGVGVAYGCTLVPLRLIDDTATIFESQIANALAHRATATSNVIAVSNNSWGPKLYGTLLGSIGTTIDNALQSGVTSGRGGRGTIYVFSAGNGRSLDRMDYNGLANDRRVIAVGALGPDGTEAYYSEQGLAVLVAAPGGGDDQSAMVSCDRTDAGATVRGFEAGSYTTVTPALSAPAVANGTSFSAPLVSGTAALMLEANPQLSWRDVPWLLATTARPVGSTTLNAAGLRFNDASGAGLIDASAAITAAASWIPLPRESYYESTVTTIGTIPDNTGIGLLRTFNLTGVPADFVVERAVLMVSAAHTSRGQLSFTLTSPAGTAATVAGRTADTGDNYNAWPFTSVWTLGEGGTGTWTLVVKDETTGVTGTLNACSLRIYGYLPYLAPTFNAHFPSAVQVGQTSVTFALRPTFEPRSQGGDLVSQVVADGVAVPAGRDASGWVSATCDISTWSAGSHGLLLRSPAVRGPNGTSGSPADAAAVTILMRATNAVPIGTSSAGTATAGQATTSGSAAFTDGDGDAMRYALRSAPVGSTTTVNPLTGAVSFRPASASTGSQDVVVYASDGMDDSADVTITYSVSPAPAGGSSSGGGGGGGGGCGAGTGGALGLFTVLGLLSLRRRRS